MKIGYEFNRLVIEFPDNHYYITSNFKGYKVESTSRIDGKIVENEPVLQPFTSSIASDAKAIFPLVGKDTIKTIASFLLELPSSDIYYNDFSHVSVTVLNDTVYVNQSIVMTDINKPAQTRFSIKASKKWFTIIVLSGHEPHIIRLADISCVISTIKGFSDRYIDDTAVCRILGAMKLAKRNSRSRG